MEKCPLTGRPCNNPKIFEISEIVDGQVRSLSLCGKCAGSYFSDERMSDDIRKKTPPMTLEKILADFVNFSNPSNDKCPSCKSTIKQIQENQKLGCLHCYEFFGNKLDEILLKNKKQEKQEVKIEKNPPWAEDCFKMDTIEKFLQYIAMELSDAIEYEQYESVNDLEKKFDEAKKIFDEKTLLEGKVNEAIKENDFDKAKEIKCSIKTLVAEYLSSQEL